MLKYISIFAFLVCFLSNIAGQNYYNLGEISGIDMSLYEEELEEGATQLIDSLPEDYRDSFKVITFSYYIHSEDFNEEVTDLFQKAIDSAEMISPYFLLITRQVNKEKQNTKVLTELRLPENWLEICFDDAYIKNIHTSIKVKFSQLGNDLPSSESFKNIDINGMREVQIKFGEINCCLPMRTEEECNGCISAYNVYDELMQMGFTPLYNSKIINRDNSVDQLCLCSNLSTIAESDNVQRRYSNVNDLAEFDIKIDNVTVSLSETLQEVADELDNFVGIITKNITFCDPNLVETQEDLFNESKFSGWIHVWENPIDDSNHVILFKARLDSTASSFGRHLLPQCTAEPFKNPTGETVNPNFTYTVSQRCFAPWDRFGHLPLFPNKHFGKNSFHGDNRGFSLFEFSEFPKQNFATARLFQFITVKLKDGIFKHEALCGSTIGYRNMIRTLPKTPFNPVITLQEQSKSQEAISDKDVDKIKNGVSINMQIQASNPLADPIIKNISWFTPDLENQLKLNIYFVKNDNSIHVHGLVCTKNFPAYEVILKDNCGNKVFLYTASSPCESQLAYELIWNGLDHQEYFDFKIPVNNLGCFLTDISVMDVNRNTNQEEVNLTYSISAWNALNLQKQPAVDCPSIPCQGAYRNDGDDLRSIFNCID